MDAKLTLSRRKSFGKKAKSLVNEGNTLANIFGKGRESIAAYGEVGVIDKVVSAAGKNHPIEITLEDDGETVLALVNEVERDFKTSQIHHVTFQVVIKGQKVSTEVPIEFIGDAPATKTGLIVVTSLDVVEVETIPSKIPETIQLSLESLVEDGDSLHVSDLKVDSAVVIKNDPDQLVVKVETPRSQIESEDTDEENSDAADVPSDHGGDEADQSE